MRSLPNKLLRKSLGYELRRVVAEKKSAPKTQKDLMDFGRLSEYIRASAEAYAASAKLPDFLTPTSLPLTIDLHGKKVRLVRIELPGKSFLHLRSITLTGRNNSAIPSKDISVAASSYYGDSGERIESGEVFNTNTKYACNVHTENERQPWLLLSLKKPTSLGSITLSNRPDFYAIRAAGMRVLVSEDGEQWQEVYTVGGQEFFDKIARLSAKFKLNTYEGGSNLKLFVRAILVGDNERARKVFKRFSPEFKLVLRDTLNAEYLNARQRDWTVHGMQRSFRFWSKSEKIDYIKFTNTLLEDLKPLSNDVCFGFGSVLCLVRDKDLMPHDDDLDLIIGFKKSQVGSFTQARELVKNHLESLGYQVEGEFFSLWHIRIDSEKKADVFIGIYDDDGTIGWYPGARGAFKRSDIFPAIQRQLLGQPCSIPHNPTKYLEATYGPDWKEPNPVWRHAWNKAEYLDLE